MTEARPPIRPPIRCTVCGRVIEVCVCCEREDCPEPTCQPDLLVTQRVSTRQPHRHGG